MDREQTFIVLMRGINVGATRKVPMAELRALCLEVGLERPETYVQSGNLIVDAPGSAEKLRALLEPAMAERFGFAVDLIVRPASAWAGYIAANPFAGDTGMMPKMLHLCLSRDALKVDAGETLQRAARSGERIIATGDAVWIDYGASGVARSRLTPALIDKACGSPTTGRNWNSVLAIGELVAART